MLRTLLKLFICVVVGLPFVTGNLREPRAAAYAAAPPPGRTGAPGESTCAVCHNSFALNSGSGVLGINGLPETYAPNQEITVTVRLRQTNRALFGFQVTALDDGGRAAGTLIITDDLRVQREVGNVDEKIRFYLQHTLAGLTPTAPDQGEWTFKWRAPAPTAGRVTFYAVGNAANGNGGLGGDYIYTASASLRDEQTQAAYEADVAPRPDGSRDGTVTTADWVQVGRFVAGLDDVTASGEFQRADCAPAATRGDGRLTVSDWVQAGRYAAGLDAVVTAGGPMIPQAASQVVSQVAAMTLSEFFHPFDSLPMAEVSPLSLRNEPSVEALFDGQRLIIQLDAQGTENAVGFSLAYDARQWRAVAATLGSDATNAQTLVNAQTARQGRLGFMLALPAGETFAPGLHNLVAITFRPLPQRRASFSPDFQLIDEPIAREVVRANLR